MKRLIAAAILIGVIVTLCLCGAKTVSPVCRETEQLLNDARTAYRLGDFGRAATLAGQAHDRWRSHRHLLFFFVNRDTVDEITEGLETLSASAGLPTFEPQTTAILGDIERVITDQTFRLEHFV